ncbi:hypothetical protein EMIT0324P_60277 [Pseudomonas chlororaphis]
MQADYFLFKVKGKLSSKFKRPSLVFSKMLSQALFNASASIQKISIKQNKFTQVVRYF